MRLGQAVPGSEHYSFIAEDQHHICDRVREYDSECRLVMSRHDRHVALMRWVQGDFAPQGEWMVGFTWRNPETQELIIAEPDARILQIQRRADLHRRARPQDYRKRLRKSLELRKHREAHQRKEIIGPQAERAAHEMSNALGVGNRAYVPRGV